MSTDADEVTRGVIHAYLLLSCPPFAVAYLLSGLPWWLLALLVLLGVAVALVWGLNDRVSRVFAPRLCTGQQRGARPALPWLQPRGLGA